MLHTSTDESYGILNKDMFLTFTGKRDAVYSFTSYMIWGMCFRNSKCNRIHSEYLTLFQLLL